MTQINTYHRTSPQPESGEPPACFAERLGVWYAAATEAGHKKSFGQYLTPVDVARFMVRNFNVKGDVVRVLDPGAGTGILSCALCEHIADRVDGPVVIELDVYETDRTLAIYLHDCLSYLREWLNKRSATLNFVLHTTDFVLENAEGLNETPRLFADSSVIDKGFDVVVTNPPYFKIPKADPRAQIASSVVHGQPNIYAIFLSIAATLLKQEGELIAIIPRSFAAGPYFRRFREHFFSMMQPLRLHLFNSRRDAFARDEVLQENLILITNRREQWIEQCSDESVAISVSSGVSDLGNIETRIVPSCEVIDMTSREKTLRIPLSDHDDAITQLVHSWSGSLHSYGLQISTGPVVAFRATALLSHHGEITQTHAPLLWMQNVQPMQVVWPANARGKAQYITVSPDSMSLVIPTMNYVVMRRFSAKEGHRRIIAAPLPASMFTSQFLSLENHLNYIYRPGGSLTEDEAYGLAALFNSDMIDRYFRISNGNTQVSATELRAMPLPSLELIVALGQRVRMLNDLDHELDAMVEEIVGVPLAT